MALVAIDPGLSTTVQDEGRTGYREWGVPLGGAFDRGSAALANALIGNLPGCAVLEFTLFGGTYQAQQPMSLALAGAPMKVRVVSEGSPDRPIPLPASFSVREGDRLILGRSLSGARTYLAVRGGWQVKAQLGSRSSERRIQAGEVFAAAPGLTAARRYGEPIWKSATIEPLRIIPGPDRVSNPALDDEFWSGRRFRVAPKSNRMGLRLQGDPISVASPPDRLSAPVAPGAIQVAGSALIVLGVACGTMGGYPHIAHVISADLDRLGQLAPGDYATFRLVTVEEARALDRAAREARKALLHRLATIIE